MQHRLATHKDFDFIYDIYMDQTSNPYLTYDFMEKKDFKKIYASLLDTHTLFVVEDNKQLVGTYRLIPKQYRQEHCVYLGSFGVPQALRGKGYGWAILEGIREKAQQNGLSRIELTVDLHNQAAIYLYQKAGFEIEGTIRNSYRLKATNRFYDEYLMALIL